MDCTQAEGFPVQIPLMPSLILELTVDDVDNDGYADLIGSSGSFSDSIVFVLKTESIFSRDKTDWSEYLYNEKMNLIFGSIQVLVLMITVFISIFKPWRSKNVKK